MADFAFAFFFLGAGAFLVRKEKYRMVVMIGPTSTMWPIAPLKRWIGDKSVATKQSEKQMGVESLVSLLEFQKWSLVVGSWTVSAYRASCWA